MSGDTPLNTKETNAVILGCGYVGRRLAEDWLHQGLNVTTTTTTPAKVDDLKTIGQMTHPNVVVIRGDDAKALETLLSNQTVLLVAVASQGKRSYQDTYLATAQTLAQVLPHTTIRQVIYTGSFGVYGNHGGHWVTEDTAIAPATDNAQVMADAEHALLSIASEQQRVCILRLGGIYGPGRELLKIFRRRSGTVMAGDGKDPSNWIHLDDIAGAIDFARTHQLQGIYNLVQDTILSRRELLDRLFETYHLPGVHWDPSLPGRRSHSVKVSNQKIKNAGYTFIHQDFWMPADYTMPPSD